MNRDEILQLFRDNQTLYFSYRKVDGSKRSAFGTLDSELIERRTGPSEKKSDGERKENLEVVRYYDLNSEGWRSFKVDNFIGVDDVRN